MKSTTLSAIFRAGVWCLAAALCGGELKAGAARAHDAVPTASPGLSGVLADAHRLAKPMGGSVVRVSGASMLPYFGEGSVLVLRGTAAENLREGMIVVYRNRFNELVAHRVERLAADGWVVRGANNRSEDSTRVTAENLLGVVYVTLHSDPRAGGAVGELASALTESTPLALAATAR